MKVNVILDDNNIIAGFQSIPLDPDLPVLEIDDPYSISIGYDKFSDGKLVKDSGKHDSNAFERILQLKKMLAETDYKAIKFMEGEITEEDYASIKAQRQTWRSEINELEKTLK